MGLVLSLSEVLRTLDPDSREFQVAIVAAYEKVANATAAERDNPEWQAQAMENYRAISERFMRDPDALASRVGPCKAVAVFATVVDHLDLRAGPEAVAVDFVIGHGRTCGGCQEAISDEIEYRERKRLGALVPKRD